VDAHYDAVYGYAAEEQDVVVTTLAVTAYGQAPAFELPVVEPGSESPPPEAVELRRELVAGGTRHRDVPFYRRALLRAGNVVDGPAGVDDELGTILVPPDTHACVDAHGTLVIRW
jgi:N-methylhydantoinase A